MEQKWPQEIWLVRHGQSAGNVARDVAEAAGYSGELWFRLRRSAGRPLRGGDVAGEHEVIFAAEGERVLFGHKASSRQVFAAGAIRAALWTKGQSPGLYNMRHVLGFED